jgi:hypothetical protein
MTVKLSVSLPDDVAAWLAQQRNVSAAVADAVRAQIGADELRRYKRRQDAATYVQHARAHGLLDHDELDEATFAISAEGCEW